MKYTLKSLISPYLYRVGDLLRRNNSELRKIESICTSFNHLTILGNAPTINTIDIPISNIIVCNHFWRHPHYKKIKSGYHIISDYNFILAKDIHDFIENVNQNLIIVCSKKVRRALIKRGMAHVVLFGVHYSGSWPIWRYGVKKSQLNRICQTGSTVVADIGFPLAVFLNVKKISIKGVTLDYGPSYKDYAFSVENSVLASDFYMKNIFYDRASKSLMAWIEYFEEKGGRIQWD